MFDTLDRRALLQAGGALVVSFSLRPAAAFAAEKPSTLPPKPVTLDEVDSFLSIARDGRVTVYSGKVELGTGVETALTQIAAEELDVPLARVQIVQGDTALTPDQGPTYGSLSIQVGGVQLRQAAATARKALLTMASQKLGAPAEGLTISDGVIAAPGGKRVTFGELIGDKRFTAKLDKDAAPKDPKSYKFVGQSVRRLDIPDKITARFTYMQDMRMPGMLHGRVVRPTAIGASLQSVDETSVKDIPDLVKIVREGNFLGVVCRSEWGAVRAVQALKATWSGGGGLPDRAKLWEHVRGTKIVKEEVTSTVGDADAVLASAAKKLSATYDFAIHTHGSIGPSCAIANFADGQLTVWTASQMTHTLWQQLAKMFSLPADKVRAIYVEGAGCYGRNGHEDAAADAALMSRAVGKPVRVQWMRADEHGWDPKGPPTLIDCKGAIGTDGSVAAWRTDFYIPQGGAGPVPLVAADLAKLPNDVGLFPGGIQQNSAIPYKFATIATRIHRLETTPFRPSWIRAPGRMQNTFANEAFVDELAAAANVDPLEFRMRYLDDARGKELLQRLGTFAKWQKRTGPRATASGDKVTGRGLAYVFYELNRTYVGAVADVEVDRKSGAIRVTRFAVVQDCGQVINPDGVRSQIEGNVIQTVSRVLLEELDWDSNAVTSVDWATYPILTFPDVPAIDIDLIERQTEKPWGVGEPSSSIVAPAISSAVFDAIGVRLRSVPFVPEKVLAALRAA
ncbi:xanthine dehydrogenase family protein molybdopterin-binding subunit [Roseiterribacter gracilis]|uniref:Aldehyde dehydrogenase n=1 Tax=Roseiterribacter gracilis TaxID=2812848 RepID=A0A8S8X680_9PROT|nr:aldehyde dehydrogenase [Rhodospirillales bacterium TMPK1]